MRSLYLAAVVVVALLAANGCDGTTQRAEPLVDDPTAPREVPSVLPAASSQPTATPEPTHFPEPTATPEPTAAPQVDPDPDGDLPVEVVAEIPDGFTLLAHAGGDLDGDGDDSDLAVVVHMPDDADFASPDEAFPPRPVLLFVADAGGQLHLVARSDGAALCGRCGGTFGDPFSELVVDAGSVSVVHYGGSAWRWTHTPTFTHDPETGEWWLTSLSETSFHASDPDTTFEDLTQPVTDAVTFTAYQAAW